MSRSKSCLDVLDYLSDGKWHHLDNISSVLGLSQTGCSARIRDLRKSPLFLAVECKPAPVPGPFLYRIPGANLGVARRARDILVGKD